MTDYVFITGDSFSFDGSKINAQDIAEQRIEKKYWPIGPNTPNKTAINVGDTGYIYIAGTGLNKGCIKYVVAITEKKRGKPSVVCEADESMAIFSHLTIEKISEKTITLKDELLKQGIISEKDNKWGALLTGGIRRISGLKID